MKEKSYHCIVELQNDRVLGVYAPYDTVKEAIKHLDKLEERYIADGIDMKQNRLIVVHMYRPDYIPE